MHHKIFQALLCLLLRSIPAQVDSSCPLKYLEQPPDQINCNPYPREELLLECTISLQSQFLHLHGLPPSALELHWFHSQQTHEAGEMQVVTTNQEEREFVTDQAAYDGEQTPPVITQLEDLQENVFIIEQTLPIRSGDTVQVRSRLELYRLNESDMGAYWCSIHFNYTKEPLSKTLVVASDSVLLGHPRDYAYREQCISNIAQSKQENKCALSSSTTPLPQVDSKGTITPNHGVTAATPHSVAEQTPLEGDKKSDGGKGHILKEFYIALGVLVAFGSIIAVLVLVVVCTCLQYRKMLNAKQTLRGDQEAVILQSLPPSDYLIPVPVVAQTSGDTSLATINSGVDNPVYASTLLARKHLTSRWLQQQQPQQQELHEVQLQVPRRSEIFLHSYETIMSDDYEDMTGTKYDPMLMKKNDAYVDSSTLSRTLPLKTQLE